jgi:hypothetical protein
VLRFFAQRIERKRQKKENQLWFSKQCYDFCYITSSQDVPSPDLLQKIRLFFFVLIKPAPKILIGCIG